jgi:hypothetical protein
MTAEISNTVTHKIHVYLRPVYKCPFIVLRKVLLFLFTIVTCTPIARQRVGKRVPAKKNSDKESVARLRNNRGCRVFYVVRAKQQ